MKTILVVDDEKDIRQLLKDKLEKSGYKVATAENGQAALTVCAKDVADLILLDIAMPIMDGYETCEKLRQNQDTRAVPVVFLTGKELETESILRHCEALCAAGCISKFSTLKDLLIKVKEVIG